MLISKYVPKEAQTDIETVKAWWEKYEKANWFEKEILYLNCRNSELLQQEEQEIAEMYRNCVEDIWNKNHQGYNFEVVNYEAIKIIDSIFVVTRKALLEDEVHKIYYCYYGQSEKTIKENKYFTSFKMACLAGILYKMKGVNCITESILNIIYYSRNSRNW